MALNKPVRAEADEVTTIAALLEQGRVVLRRSDCFAGRGGKLRVAYFADYVKDCDPATGRTSGWEISKLAFLSRRNRWNRKLTSAAYNSRPELDLSSPPAVPDDPYWRQSEDAHWREVDRLLGIES